MTTPLELSFDSFPPPALGVEARKATGHYAFGQLEALLVEASPRRCTTQQLPRAGYRHV